MLKNKNIVNNKIQESRLYTFTYFTITMCIVNLFNFTIILKFILTIILD